ncbi:WXG100 family type VII secretion target [Streptomyces sparsogenes]|uniref:WXG100 family type VII secretion target n=1 Tax=Streptomyces sparsogenes TaxID=67365 RepID=UPI0033EAD2C9
MSGTVKVDDAAHAASRKFLGIINGGLQQSISQLSSAGNTLSDQSHWDGRHAAEFRTAWHSAQADLNKIKQQLEEFQRTFDTILKNISQAGGNG